MIGGIFGTIGKTLGIGKEKYFLELDDAAEESVGNIKEAAVKATKVAKSTAVDIADKAQDLASEVADVAQDAASETAAKAKAETKKAAAKGKAKVEKVADKAGDKAAAAGKKAKNAAKETAKKSAAATKKESGTKDADKKTKGEKALQAAEPVAKLPPATPVARDPEDIIREAIAAGGQKTDASGNVASGPTNFSTDYLMMPTGNRGRRRPGPSLSPFKDMAKETNPRLKK